MTGVWIMLIEGHQVGLELEQDGTAVQGAITARMLDDGTLEGELTTNKGRTKWTGERLQKK